MSAPLPVIIIGASGHGAVIADLIQQAPEYDLVGFVDSRRPTGAMVLGVPVLGNEGALLDLHARYGAYGICVGVGDNWLRGQLVRRLKELPSDIAFVPAVHPSAQIASSARLGRGVTVMAGAVVNCGAEIGDFCIVNTKASLDHGSRMHPYSSLAPGVTIGGDVEIGSFSAIGIGAVVREKVRIGASTVIGAGAVVLADVPDNVTAFGCPARVVHPRAVSDPYLR